MDNPISLPPLPFPSPRAPHTYPYTATPLPHGAARHRIDMVSSCLASPAAPRAGSALRPLQQQQTRWGCRVTCSAHAGGAGAKAAGGFACGLLAAWAVASTPATAIAAGQQDIMNGGDNLKLLGSWASPFVTRVKFALTLKALIFEDVEEDLRNKSELLLASNPVQKKVPVLIHNGKPICESLIILQYIDEVFSGTGPSLLPAEPHDRAVTRFWAAYVDDKLVVPWVQSMRGKTEEDKAEGIKQTLVAVEMLEGALRDCSKGEGLFFGGDRVGLVDVSLGSLLSWLKATEVMSGAKIFDPVKTPLLAAWMERFSELDMAKAALPDVDRLVEFAKKMTQAAAAAAAAASEN